MPNLVIPCTSPEKAACIKAAYPSTVGAWSMDWLRHALTRSEAPDIPPFLFCDASGDDRIFILHTQRPRLLLQALETPEGLVCKVVEEYEPCQIPGSRLTQLLEDAAAWTAEQLT